MILKKKISRISKLVLLAVLFLLINNFWACNDPLDGVVLPISLNIYNNTVALQFVNANPESSDIPEVSIQVLGKDADKVVNISGGDDFTVINGIVSLAIESDRIPSSTNPIQIEIIAKADGYLTAYKTVMLFEGSHEQITLNMLQFSNLPEGVSMTQVSFDLNAQGAVSQQIAVETPLVGEKTEKGYFKIEKGTILYDQNGNVATGKVMANFLHLDNQSEAARHAFPGGFFVIGAEDVNGNEVEPSAFYTAGLVCLTLEVPTGFVKTFSQPIELKIDVNENTENADEGFRSVQEGDKIPVWSLDEQGKWTLEGNTTINRNSEGVLQASFQAPHLSDWNFDWFIPLCFGPTFIDVQSDLPPQFLLVEVRSRNRTLSLRRRFVRNNGAINLNCDIPLQANVEVLVWSGFSWWNRGILLGRSTPINTCLARGQIQISGNIVSCGTLQIKAACANKPDVELLPTTHVWYRPQSEFGRWLYLGLMEEGELPVCLPFGRTYEFGTWYNNEFHTESLTIDGSGVFTIELTDEFCDG